MFTKFNADKFVLCSQVQLVSTQQELLLFDRYEKVRISCDVVSNPSSDLSFHWVFNTTSDRVDIDQARVMVEGTRSIVEYVPRSVPLL